MQLCVVGTGYVGLVAGPCLADLGHHVVCVDKDERRIRELQEGRIPIFEPGLAELVARGTAASRLRFGPDVSASVASADVVFIAVGTPPAADGSADLSGVFAVADTIAASMTKPTTVVIKSTVPVGTADAVRERMAPRAGAAFDVVSNPEFLAEGTAIEDFCRPDRIVIGYRERSAREVMERLYAPLVRTGRPILFMDNRSAEMSKYASNAMLATRITFMNEIANLCEGVGADVDFVRRVVGSDQRIGSRYLFPGCGYGGSCFPKDVQALLQTGQSAGVPLDVANAVHRVNERQKRTLARKVAEFLGEDWSGKRIAVWGLAFKPRTDDVREAPSLVFIEEALRRGASVVAHDPEAVAQTRSVIGDRISIADNPMNALDGADALVIATDWNEFRSPDFADMARRMRRPVIVDGRNLFDPAEVASFGFYYRGVGRIAKAPTELS